MRRADRWTLAIGLVILDLVAVVVPLTAFLAAWILVARPPWFRAWVEELYRDP